MSVAYKIELIIENWPDGEQQKQFLLYSLQQSLPKYVQGVNPYSIKVEQYKPSFPKTPRQELEQF